MSQDKFQTWRSYVDSTHWIKKKKATVNPKKEDDKRFQYVATVASNHEEIKRNPKRM